jgi:hypothetical protein
MSLWAISPYLRSWALELQPVPKDPPVISLTLNFQPISTSITSSLSYVRIIKLITVHQHQQHQQLKFIHHIHTNLANVYTSKNLPFQELANNLAQPSSAIYWIEHGSRWRHLTELSAMRNCVPASFSYWIPSPGRRPYTTHLLQ